jgi:beta-phosphoglucomutase
MPREAVIFDLDGVLLDSMPCYYRAWQRAFETRNIEVKKDEFYRREGEKRTKTVVELFEGDKGHKPSARIIEQIIGTMQDAFLGSFEAKLFPHTRELLTALKRKRTKLGLVTGSDSLEQMLGQERDLLGLFDVIVTGQDTREGKPSPQPYEAAVRRLGISPECCCAVENSPLGIQSAKAARLFCFAVRNSSPILEEELRQSGADFVCRTNEELMKHLI